MDNQIKEIAERLCGLRDVLQLSVEDFAQLCGIDKAEYEKAETGEGDISLSMLQKIARKNNVSLDELMFGLEPRMTKFFLTRNGAGVSIERREAYKYQSLASGFKGRLMDPFLVTVSPNDEPLSLNKHAGQEFDIVVKGTLLISIDGKEHLLRRGDTIYFNAQYLHGMKALNGEEAQFIAIII